MTAWEREIATYELDSGQVLDDEIKIGTFLPRLPESQLKTHLLRRVDMANIWTDFRSEVGAISRAISAAQSQPTAMDIGAVGKGAKGGGKRHIQTQQACSRLWKHGSHSSKLSSLRRDVPNMWKGRSSG